MTEAWTVLACGDASRGDDGAALAALERLPHRLPASIQLRACGLLEPGELVAALLSGPCLLLDSVHGVEPGSVVELPLARLLSGDDPIPASSHALPMPIIIGLAEALGAPLGRGSFLGIGGASFGLGQPLSPAVEAGLDAYARAIADHLPRGRRPRCA